MELPDNHIGPEQAFLLRRDVEFAIRIEPVQTTNLNIGKGGLHFIKNSGIGDGMGKLRMT